MTNLEYIRSCSDDELASFLTRFGGGTDFEDAICKSYCPVCPIREACIADMVEDCPEELTTENQVKAWLKDKYEEADGAAE